MIEILDPAQPWEVPLPVSWNDQERGLAAYIDGCVVVAWRFEGGRWLTHAQSEGPGDTFSDIVRRCMDRGWRLYSMPRLAPSGADGTGTGT